MNRSRCLILFAALSSLAACDSDKLLSPDRTRAAQVVLTANASAPLSSFGDTAVVTPRVLDQHGKPVEGARLRWSVAPEGIVVRESDGIYRAIGNGRVTIVAELDIGDTGVRPSGYWAAPVADSVVIEVQQRPARLALGPVDSAFTTIGALRRIPIQVTDARGNPMLDALPPLTWHSADVGVATVDNAGVVRSVGEGVTQITARGGELSGSFTFTVQPRLPHTSCMVYLHRRQTRESCVTLDFIMREREAGR